MRHVIAGTAGHIDHGKTHLVRALTGVDCDRLEEEKERGITIDIGFAPLALEENLHVGFVDVPGHERFVKNMLAGASGIDLVILVVAADESVKPQTREHFDVCRLLDVGSGLVALTKCDLADDEMRELVALEIRDLVAGSFLEGAPVVPVSAVTGEGLADLKAALATAARAVNPRAPGSFFRLPVDRAFTIKGFGTVVTGTMVSGSVREGEEVAIYPEGRKVRVRGVQVHGQTVERAWAGQRTALNLQGVEVGQVARGALLAPPALMRPSSLLDVRLTLLPDARIPLKDMARVRYHQGTSELLARVKLLQEGPLEPGSEGLAQVRLESPATSLPGDRFVIRQYSPMITVGGGVILDAHPEKHRGRAAGAAARLAELVPGDAEQLASQILGRSPAGVVPGELVLRTGLDPSTVERLSSRLVEKGTAVAVGGAGGFLLDRGRHRALRKEFLDRLEAFHRAHPLALGMPREELLRRVAPGGSLEVARRVLEGMAVDGMVRLEKEIAAAAGHAVSLGPEEEEIRHKLEAHFSGAGLNPSTLEEIVKSEGLDAPKAQRIYHLLLAGGSLVRIKDGKVYHADAIEGLKKRLWKLRETRKVIDVAAFKELTGTSRKNAIPLLEHLDAERVTRRRQNDREILPPPGAEAS